MKFSPNPIAGFVPCPKCNNAALVHFPKGGARQNTPYLHCMEHGSIQNQTKSYFEEKAVTTLDLFRELHGDSDSVVTLGEAIKTKGLLMDISQLSRLKPEPSPPAGDASFEPIEELPEKDKNMQVTVTEEGDVLPPEPPQSSEEMKSESSAVWIGVGLLVVSGALYGGFRVYKKWQSERARA